MLEPHEDFRYPLDLTGSEVSQLGLALGEILDWVYASGRAKIQGAHVRMYVLAWLVRPGFFDDSTQADIAQKLRIRSDVFCREVTSFRNRFQFFSPLCNSEEARKNKANGAIRRHQGQ